MLLLLLNCHIANVGSNSRLAGLLFLFQLIHQVDNQEESRALVVMLDGLYGNGDGKVCFPRTLPSEQQQERATR